MLLKYVGCTVVGARCYISDSKLFVINGLPIGKQLECSVGDTLTHCKSTTFFAHTQAKGVFLSNFLLCGIGC